MPIRPQESGYDWSSSKNHRIRTAEATPDGDRYYVSNDIGESMSKVMVTTKYTISSRARRAAGLRFEATWASGWNGGVRFIAQDDGVCVVRERSVRRRGGDPRCDDQHNPNKLGKGYDPPRCQRPLVRLSRWDGPDHEVLAGISARSGLLPAECLVHLPCKQIASHGEVPIYALRHFAVGIVAALGIKHVVPHALVLVIRRVGVPRTKAASFPGRDQARLHRGSTELHVFERTSVPRVACAHHVTAPAVAPGPFHLQGRSGTELPAFSA